MRGYDYVSPNLARIAGKQAFPNLVIEDGRTLQFGDEVRTDPHLWYHDGSSLVGFVNADEAHLIHNNAIQFAGKPALEIGCASGFSAWHILAAGMRVQICDPVFTDGNTVQRVSGLLSDKAGLSSVPSPQGALELGRLHGPFSFVFIDANHDDPYPMIDAIAADYCAAADAMIMLHDVVYPGPYQAMHLLRAKGWQVGIYRTSQLLGCAWRGEVSPVKHIPDPAIVEYTSRFSSDMFFD